MKKQPTAPALFSSRAPGLAGLAFSFLAMTISATAVAADKTPRIVGGTDTTITQYPWQAALLYNTDAPVTIGCGGSIIHEKWILTAAHCKPTAADDFDIVAVMVGATDRTDIDDAQVIPIKRFIAHEDFVDENNTDEDKITLDNDIALIELETAIDFTACGSRCATIPLVISSTESDLAPVSTQAFVSGWGSTLGGVSDDAEYPDILQQTDLNIVDCTASPSVYESGWISSRMICAAVSDYSRDSCFGDSGGPLVVANSSGTGFVQAGIVSWGGGEGCASFGNPGVYARVAKFSSWIWDTTDGECCNEPVIDNPLNELADSDGGGGNGGTLTLSLLLSLPLLLLLPWLRLAFSRRRGERA